MSICAKCGADSNHLNDVGVCPSEFGGGWIDNVKEGDRFRVSRPVPAGWLEQDPSLSPPSYTLKEIEALARLFVDHNNASADTTKEYAIKYRMFLSSFLIWLARREREGRDGNESD